MDQARGEKCLRNRVRISRGLGYRDDTALDCDRLVLGPLERQRHCQGRAGVRMAVV